MSQPDFPNGIWAVDFEFHPAHGQHGNVPVPVCMVAQELQSGQTLRFWHDELFAMHQAPFPTDGEALFVSYYASAEFGCFQQLGWAPPTNTLDLFSEFCWLTNGRHRPHGKGLIGALLYFGLPAIDTGEKNAWRDLVMRRGPWSAAERLGILDYCETDVVSLAVLFPKMQPLLDWPRALLRGRYSQALAAMETAGVPIDTDILAKLIHHWPSIQDQLIADVDKDFQVYKDGSFKAARFAQYLNTQGIPWPRLPAGALALDDKTFKGMAAAYPQLAPLRELRRTLSAMDTLQLPVGVDGRNRCLLSAFGSTTGRNQPSTTRFIFGLPKWLRGLIRPQLGRGVAYIDWCQQEFGIAAALSGDTSMMAAYKSGDPYLAFAKQAGAVPQDATKHTHEAEREQFKACVLAVQYGMGAESLALRIGQPEIRARQLLALHRRTYRTFWGFSDSVLNEAILGGRLWTSFGWQIHTQATHGKSINPRSICNFPMQANGSEMLRLACILLEDAGIKVCAPVHDALLIEAPADQLGSTVARAQALMAEASKAVLDGFELSSEAKILHHPDRYMDPRGIEMWNSIMGRIGEPLHQQHTAA